MHRSLGPRKPNGSTALTTSLSVWDSKARICICFLGPPTIHIYFIHNNLFHIYIYTYLVCTFLPKMTCDFEVMVVLRTSAGDWTITSWMRLDLGWLLPTWHRMNLYRCYRWSNIPITTDRLITLCDEEFEEFIDRPGNGSGWRLVNDPGS